MEEEKKQKIELEIIKRFEKEKKKLDEPNAFFPQDMNYIHDLKEMIIKQVFFEEIEKLEKELEFREKAINGFCKHTTYLKKIMKEHFKKEV